MIIKKWSGIISTFAIGGLFLSFYPTENTSTKLVTQAEYKKYARVKLTTDLSILSFEDRQMIPLLIEAAEIMDGLFWRQAYAGNRDSLMSSAKNEKEKEYLTYNYGPWDRLNGNRQFKDGYAEKPLGSNFYPEDMTVEEFEELGYPNSKSLYTLLRRGNNGKLMTVPYHIEYLSELSRASNLLMQASGLTTSQEFKEYLMARAKALLNDEYNQSDIIWLNLKDNTLDIIIGPIETYEDKLFGYKAAYEAYVLVKDHNWSSKLRQITSYLPALQLELPVEEKYKKEAAGLNSQLVVYDVIYYAGDCNSGSKTIAVNLPNDEQLQVSQGTRRSQFKNVMKAKFEQILVPIADQLITVDQRQHIKFMAFFSNTMFHEVAHGLGVKNTINGKGTVRLSLKRTRFHLGGRKS
jgi:hypothetical protein